MEDSTLSAEVVREQLALRGIGVTAGQKVPSAVQVGGDHYVKRKIGPWDIWAEYGMNAFEGAVLKYLLRWRDKNGVEDLKKARHTLDKLIELEEAKGDPEAG